MTQEELLRLVAEVQQHQNELNAEAVLLSNLLHSGFARVYRSITIRRKFSKFEKHPPMLDSIQFIDTKHVVGP